MEAIEQGQLSQIYEPSTELSQQNAQDKLDRMEGPITKIAIN